MNYMLFRIIIFVIFVLISAIIFKFVKNVKIRRILAIIGLLMFIFICYYPIENNLFKFNSVDKAFKYYYPAAKIKKKYEYDNYAYVVYDDRKYDVPGLMYLIKKDNRWIINNLLTKGNSKERLRESAYFTISTIELPKMNSAGIIMYYYPLFIKNNEKMSDSLSSVFKIYEDEGFSTSIVIINQKVDSNYTIYFNGEEYKPFKK